MGRLVSVMVIFMEVILRSEKDSRRVQLWRVAQLLPTRMVKMYIRDLGVYSKIIDPSIPDNGLYGLNIVKRRASKLGCVCLLEIVGADAFAKLGSSLEVIAF
jgi:hypothetical protein